MLPSLPIRACPRPRRADDSGIPGLGLRAEAGDLLRPCPQVSPRLRAHDDRFWAARIALYRDPLRCRAPEERLREASARRQPRCESCCMVP